MVAIVSGNSLGLLNTSAGLLGADGLIGDPSTGTNKESAIVNVSNGNLILQQGDDFLAAQGQEDIDSIRTYNSLGNVSEGNGLNWSMSMIRVVNGLTLTVNTAGSTITRTDGDGNQVVYTYNSTLGKYIGHEGGGADDTLSYNSGSSIWTWTNGTSGATETYGSNGFVTSASDINGNTLTYSYTGGLLSKITDSAGDYALYSYSGGNLAQISDVLAGGATSTRVYYQYDAQNRLTSVITDLSPANNSTSDSNTYTTTYTYVGTTNLIASVAQTDGSKLNFTYDGANRVATVQDALGNTTTYTYSSNQTTVKDPNNQISTYTYDSRGRLTNVAAPAVNGTVVQTSYAYGDSNGDVTGITDSYNNTITRNYDSMGNLLSQIDPQGDTVSYTYNSKNFVTSKTVYLTPAVGGNGAQNPETTYYVYDANNQVAYEISAAGRVTQNTYNYTSYSGDSTNASGGGELTKTVVFAGNFYSMTGLSPASPPTFNQLSTWAGSGAIDLTQSQQTKYVYNTRGQLWISTETASAGNNITTTYSYDVAGNLLQKKDSDGNATSYIYDGLNRQLSSIDASNNKTLTVYNDAGHSIVTTLANGLISTDTYNAAGELTSSTQRNSSNVVVASTTYAYDANGNLLMQTDPDGRSSYFLYDADNRQIASIAPNGQLTQTNYNANGQVSSVVRYTGLVNTSLLVNAGVPTNPSLASLTTGNAIFSTAWNSYDSAGRLVYAIDAQGYLTQNTYNGESQVISSTAYATALTAAQLQSLGTAPAVSAITLPAVTTADRTTRTYYDADGLVSGSLNADGYLTQIVRNAAGQVVQTIQYANAASNFSNTGTLDFYTAQSAVVADPVNDIYQTNFYNGAGQLTYALDGGGYLTSYSYDSAGNLLSKTRYATQATIGGQAAVGVAQTGLTAAAAAAAATAAQGVETAAVAAAAAAATAANVAAANAADSAAANADAAAVTATSNANASSGAAYAIQATQLYELINGSAPTAAGFANTVLALTGGATFASQADSLLAGATGLANYPASLSNTQFVTAIFARMAGVPVASFTPSAAQTTQIATFVGQLTQASPLTRGTVAVNILNAITGYSGTDSATQAANASFAAVVKSGVATVAAYATPTATTTTGTLISSADQTAWTNANTAQTNLATAQMALTTAQATAATNNAKYANSLTSGVAAAAPMMIVMQVAWALSKVLPTSAQFNSYATSSATWQTVAQSLMPSNLNSMAVSAFVTAVFTNATGVAPTSAEIAGLSSGTTNKALITSNILAYIDNYSGTAASAYGTSSQAMLQMKYNFDVSINVNGVSTTGLNTANQAGLNQDYLVSGYQALSSYDNLQVANQTIVVANDTTAANGANSLATVNATIATDTATLTRDVIAANLGQPIGAKATQLYELINGGAPSPAAFADTVFALRGGASVASLADGLLASGAGLTNYPSSLSNTQFVTALFARMAGVPVTNFTPSTAQSAQIAAFAAQLSQASPLTRGTVAANILTAVTGYSGSDAASQSMKASFDAAVNSGLATVGTYATPTSTVTAGTLISSADLSAWNSAANAQANLTSAQNTLTADQSIVTTDANALASALTTETTDHYESPILVVVQADYALALAAPTAAQLNQYAIQSQTWKAASVPFTSTSASNMTVSAFVTMVFTNVAGVAPTSAELTGLSNGITDKSVITSNILTYIENYSGTAASAYGTSSQAMWQMKNHFDSAISGIVGSLSATGLNGNLTTALPHDRTLVSAIAANAQANMVVANQTIVVANDVTATSGANSLTTVNATITADTSILTAARSAASTAQVAVDTAANADVAKVAADAIAVAAVVASNVVIPVSTSAVVSLANLGKPASNPAVDQTTSYTYTPLGQVASETDANGAVTNYLYDTVGNLLKTTVSAADGSVTARTDTKTYDLLGRVLTDVSGTGGTTTFTYDAAGQRMSMTDADGHRTLYYYDINGRLAYTIDGAGDVQMLSYNAQGQVAVQTTYASTLTPATLVTLNGGLITPAIVSTLTALSSTGDRIDYVSYNVRGQKVSVVDAMGYGSTYSYNAFGETITTLTQTDILGDQVEQDITYDNLGRATQTKSIDNRSAVIGIDSVTAAGTGMIVQNAQYDAFGRVIQTQDGNNNVTNTTYDRLGREVTVSDAASSKLATTTYDAFNRVLTQSDFLGTGNVTSYVYDTVHRTATVTTPAGITQSTTENVFGEKVSITDGDKNVTTYQYDQDGNLTSVSAYDANGNLVEVKGTRTYDGANDLTSSTDANGVVTTYTYDAANRLLIQTFDPITAQNPQGLSLTSTTGYNSSSQVWSVTDPKGIVTQTAYDLDGQVKSVTVDPTGLNLVTGYQYDARGKVLQVTDANGNVTAYQYDALGRRVAEAVNPAGLNLVTSYVYDNDNNVIAATDPNGNVTRYVYDNDNRVVYQVNSVGDVTHTVYDANGNVTLVTHYVNTIATGGLGAITTPLTPNAIIALLTPDATRDNSITKLYDADNRLVYTIDGTNAVTYIAYDANGNVTKQTAYATPLPAGTALTLTAVANAVGNGNTGAGISNTAIDHTVVNFYDPLNRVTAQISSTGSNQGRLTTNQYDKNGNVVASTTYASAIALTTTAAALTPAFLSALASTASSNSQDSTRRMVYDNANRVIEAATTQGFDSSGNLRWSVTQQSYDAAGNVVARTEFANTIKDSSLVGGTAATQAQVATWINGVAANPAVDRATQMVYDNAGRLTASATAQHVDASGNLLWSVVHNSYDNNGNLVASLASATFLSSAAKTAGMSVAQWIATQSPGYADQVTRLVYDGANRLTASAKEVVNNFWAVTSNTYDGDGNVIVSTSYANYLSSISLASNPTTQQTAAWIAGIAPSPTQDRTTLSSYDADSRIIAIATASGQNANGATNWSVSTRSYDGNGNLTSETERATSGTSNGANIGATPGSLANVAQINSAIATIISSATPNAAADRTTYSVFDADNHVIYSIDPLGYVTQNAYDALGRVSATTLHANAISVTPANVASVASVVLAVQKAAAAAGAYPASADHITSFTYDAAGNLLQSTDHASNAAGMGEADSYTYDALGNKLAHVNAKGSTWKYQYNAVGKQILEADPVVTVTTVAPAATTVSAASDGSNASVNSITPTVAVANNVSLQTATSYDAFGNVTAITEAKGQPNARTTYYLYDLAGRQTTVVYPSVAVYNAVADQGNLVAETGGATSTAQISQSTQTVTPISVVTFDAVGNATTNQDVGGNISYKAYDNAGQVTYEVDAVGGVTGYTRDAFGDVTATTRYAATIGVPTQQNLQLVQLYATLTGTVPSEQNMATWIAALASGQSLVAVVGLMINSVAGLSGKTAALIVPLLYQNALGRTIVGTEADSWYAEAANGNYAQLVIDFTNTIVGEGNSTDAKFFINKTTAMQATLLPQESLLQVQAQVGAAIIQAGVGNLPITNRTVRTVYDQMGRAIRVIQPQVDDYDYGIYQPGTTKSTGAVPVMQALTVAQTTDTTYDAFGNAVQTSVYGASYTAAGTTATNGVIETLVQSTFSTFNARGQATATVTAMSNTLPGQDSVFVSGYLSTMQYDAAGNLLPQLPGQDSVFVSGYLSTMQYDAAGNLLQQTDYAQLLTNSSARAIVSSAPAAGAGDRVTNYTYDSDNRKTSQTITGTLNSGINPAGPATISALVGTTTSYGATGITTTYGYDALGNLVATTDALGGTLYTYYDALGRVIATAQTSDTAGTSNASGINDGTPVIKLTTYALDIYGNVAQQTIHAAGAASATVAGFVANSAQATDRTTSNVYDNDGHQIESIDAAGDASYTAYDAFGRVAKQWQDVTVSGYANLTANTNLTQNSTLTLGSSNFNATASTLPTLVTGVATEFKVNTYDAVGQLISTTTPSAQSSIINATGQTSTTSGTYITGTTGLLTKTNTYDAFGEVTLTAESTNGSAAQTTSLTQYDAAGRVWLSNANNGIMTANLYNVDGQVTEQVTSTNQAASNTTGVDLRNLAPATLINMLSNTNAPGNADLIANGKRYDLQGNVVMQLAPAQTVGVNATSSLLNMSMTVNASSYTPNANGPADPVSTVTVTLPAAINNLGPGDVMVQVNFPSATGTVSKVQTFNADQVVDVGTGPSVITGAALNVKWDGSPVVPSTITSVQVWKKDITGAWRQIADNTPLPAGTDSTTSTEQFGTFISIPAPQDATTPVTLYYGAPGAPLLPLKPTTAYINFGNTILVNMAGIAQGTYQYQVKYQDIGDAAVTAQDLPVHDSGTFVLSNAANLSANDANTRLVAQLFIALLNRAPNKDGLDFWSTSLNNGTNTALVVANGIYNGTEAQGDFAGDATPSAIVNAILKNVLGAPAVNAMDQTTAGQTAYANLLQTYVTEMAGDPTKAGQVALDIINYVSNYAGSDPNLAAASALFNTRMGLSIAYADQAGDDLGASAPSPAQVQAASDFLAEITTAGNLATAAQAVANNLNAQNQNVNGSNAGNVASAISAATSAAALENAQAQVAQLFITILGRAPDVSGLNAYTAALLSSTAPLSFANLASTLLKSPEATGTGPAGTFVNPSPGYLWSTTPNPTSSAFLTQVYTNLYGAAPTSGQLTNLQTLANSISAANLGASAITIAGLVVTSMVTSLLDYSGTDSSTLAVQALMNNRVAVSLDYATDALGTSPAAARQLILDTTATSTTIAMSDLAAAAVASLQVQSQALSTAAGPASALETDNNALIVDTIAANTQNPSAASAAAALTVNSNDAIAVTQIYAALFNRAPTQAEFISGMSFLARQPATMALVNAQGALADTLLAGTSSTATAFVTQIFNNAFQRAPDGTPTTGGLAFWTNALATQSRGQVAAAMLQPSSAGMTAQAYTDQATLDGIVAANVATLQSGLNSAAASAAAAVGSAPAATATTLVRRQVMELYEVLLSRAPSPTDFENGVTYLNTAGNTMYTYADAFLASPEATGNATGSLGNFSTAKAGTATQFVTQVFNLAFGRAPDTAGLNFWVNALTGSSGQAALSRGTVAVQIMTSAAGTNVQALHDQMYLDSKIAGGFQSLLGAITKLSQDATGAQKAAQGNYNLDNTNLGKAQTDLTNAQNASTAANSAANSLAASSVGPWVPTPSTPAQNAIVVAELYQVLLGRPVDSAAMPGAITAMNSTTMANFADTILGSTEAKGGSYTAAVQSSPDLFIKTVFTLAFGRQPSNDGLTFWKNYLSSNHPTLGALAVAIINGALGNNSSQVAQGQLDKYTLLQKVAGNLQTTLNGMAGDSTVTSAQALAAQYAGLAMTAYNDIGIAANAAADVAAKQTIVTNDTTTVGADQTALNNANAQVAGVTTFTNDAAMGTASTIATVTSNNVASTYWNTLANAVTPLAAELAAAKNAAATNAKVMTDVASLTAEQALVAAANTGDASVNAVNSANLLQIVQLSVGLTGAPPSEVNLESWLTLMSKDTSASDALNGIAQQILAANTTTYSTGTQSQDAYTAFVKAVFQKSMGRLPDTPGLAFWTNGLTTAFAGGMANNYASIAVGIIQSITSPMTTPASLPDAQYFNAHVVTAMAQLSATLAANAYATPSNADVQAYIDNNALIQAAAAAADDKSASTAAKAAESVAQLYLAILNRAPDTLAMINGYELLSPNNTSAAQAGYAATMFASPEGLGKYPPATQVTAFINQFYQNAFGRLPEASEVTKALLVLGGGTTSASGSALISTLSWANMGQFAITAIGTVLGYTPPTAAQVQAGATLDTTQVASQILFNDRVTQALNGVDAAVLAAAPAIAYADGIAQTLASMSNLSQFQFSAQQSLTSKGGTSPHVVTPQTNMTYDRWGNVLTVSDPRSVNGAIATSFTYNMFNQVMATYNAVGNGSGAQSDGSVSADTQAITSTTPAFGKTTYDALGRAVATTDANGNVTEGVYDGFGNVERTIDADGGINLNNYDAFGDLVEVRQLDPVAVGGQTPSNSTYTVLTDNAYVFDQMGHEVESVSAPVVLGSVANGTSIAAIDANLSNSDVTYSAVGVTGALTVTASPTSKVVMMGYDELGRKTATITTSSAGTMVQAAQGALQNDNIGLLYSIVNAVDHGTTGGTILAGDAAPVTVSYTQYDLQGNVTDSVDGDGNQTLYAYDQNHNKVRETDADGYVQTWSMATTYGGITNLVQTWGQLGGANIVYSYNGAGQMTGMKNANNVGANLQYFYNGALLSDIYDNTRAALNNFTPYTHTSYTYDLAGNKIDTRTTIALGYSYQATAANSAIYSSGAQLATVGLGIGVGQASTVVQDSHETYDAQGRNTSIEDGRYNVSNSFDANGNTTETRTTYLDDQIGAATTWTGTTPPAAVPTIVVENVNVYDSMNRAILVDGTGITQIKGVVSPSLGGTNIANTQINQLQGHFITYDTAGQRTSDNYIDKTKDTQVSEQYVYDAAGDMIQVQRGTNVVDNLVYNAAGAVVASGAATAPETAAQAALGTYTFVNSSGGGDRIAAHIAYLPRNNGGGSGGNDGTSTGVTLIVDNSIAPNAYNTTAATTNTIEPNGMQFGSTTNVYDGAGRLLESTTWSQASGTDGVEDMSDTIYAYDGVGNTLARASHNHGSAGDNVSLEQTKYQVTGSYQQQEQYTELWNGLNNTEQAPANVTLYTYDVNNNVLDVAEETGVKDPSILTRQGTISYEAGYTVTTDGMVLRTEVTGGTTDTNTDMVTNSLIANGASLGSSNDNAPTGPNAPVDTVGTSIGYATLSSSIDNTAPSFYTVNGGETWNSIAYNLWGDASLGWALQQANGNSSITAATTTTSASNASASATGALVGGTVITVPPRPTSVMNTYQTVTPYSQATALGNTTPATPVPPAQSSGCGVLGLIIEAVIVAVVAYYTGQNVAQFFSGLGPVGQAVAVGAVAGAAGDTAGQLAGEAMGLQSGFNWNEVGLSALGGAIGGGINAEFNPAKGVGAFGGALAGNTPLAVAGRAVITNVVTQGVEVATGAQKHFQWAQVAASGIGAGVGEAVSESLLGNVVDPSTGRRSLDTSFADALGNGFGAKVVGGAIAGLAGGLTTAVLKGGKVNVEQIAANAFGSAIGNSLTQDNKPPVSSIVPLTAADLQSPLTNFSNDRLLATLNSLPLLPSDANSSAGDGGAGTGSSSTDSETTGGTTSNNLANVKMKGGKILLPDNTIQMPDGSIVKASAYGIPVNDNGTSSSNSNQSNKATYSDGSPLPDDSKILLLDPITFPFAFHAPAPILSKPLASDESMRPSFDRVGQYANSVYRNGEPTGSFLTPSDGQPHNFEEYIASQSSNTAILTAEYFACKNGIEGQKYCVPAADLAYSMYPNDPTVQLMWQIAHSTESTGKVMLAAPAMGTSFATGGALVSYFASTSTVAGVIGTGTFASYLTASGGSVVGDSISQTLNIYLFKNQESWNGWETAAAAGLPILGKAIPAVASESAAFLRAKGVPDVNLGDLLAGTGKGYGPIPAMNAEAQAMAAAERAAAQNAAANSAASPPAAAPLLNSTTPTGSLVSHGTYSTAIGSDNAILENFAEATDTGDGHNLIVHGSIPKYDEFGGIFLVDQLPTNSKQIIDALLSNPAYKPGAPICLASCWGASNGLAQDVANGLNAPVTGFARPVQWNLSTGQWEQASDMYMVYQHPDLMHIIQPAKTVFYPKP